MHLDLVFCPLCQKYPDTSIIKCYSQKKRGRQQMLGIPSQHTDTHTHAHTHVCTDINEPFFIIRSEKQDQVKIKSKLILMVNQCNLIVLRIHLTDQD